MINKINALTLDIKEDGWESSRGFIMRQVEMPVLDEVKNPADALYVVIKMQYAGICGSDRGIWNRVAFEDLIHNSLATENKTMRILGHEFVGEIVQAGSMVDKLYGTFKGDMVSGDSHITCGNCYQCRLGENNVCVNEAILGISINGIFAEYVKVPAKNLWKVDTTKVRSEIAAMYDPFGNAVHAVSKVDVRGQKVAVFGCGPIGLFSILLLKHFGASKIIALDINEENLKMAGECGAHQTIKIEANNTLNLDVDIAMEMAGPASSVQNCIDSTRRGGHIILFGVKDGDFLIPKFSRLITKGLTIHSVIGRQIFKTWQVADAVLADKTNGVQEKVWDIILKQGQGTVLPFSEYTKESVEKAMNENPKVIFKF